MKKEITVYRIEDERGFGPMYISQKIIPMDLLMKLWKIPFPRSDFGICAPFENEKEEFEKFCLKNLKSISGGCFFGFPSYEVFKFLVGKFEKDITKYTTTYKTSNYLVSKSGLQVIFTKNA